MYLKSKYSNINSISIREMDIADMELFSSYLSNNWDYTYGFYARVLDYVFDKDCSFDEDYNDKVDMIKRILDKLV